MEDLTKSNQKENTLSTAEEEKKINFSLAQPPYSLIPFDLLKSATTSQPWEGSFLAYGDRRGQKELLTLIASFISNAANISGTLITLIIFIPWNNIDFK